MNEPLKSFFRKYEDAFNRLDYKQQARMFEDSFLTAGPKGVIAQDKEGFLAMAERMVGFYRSIGWKSARILDADERPISPDYSLVRTHWGATFEKTGDRMVEYDVSYVVRKTGPEPKVVMFMTHHDEQKVIEDLGLTPEVLHA